MPPQPGVDERAQHGDLQLAVRPDQIEHLPHHRRADALSLVGLVDLVVHDRDRVAGQLVRREAGELPVDVRLELLALGVVPHVDVCAHVLTLLGAHSPSTDRGAPHRRCPARAGNRPEEPENICAARPARLARRLRDASESTACGRRSSLIAARASTTQSTPGGPASRLSGKAPRHWSATSGSPPTATWSVCMTEICGASPAPAGWSRPWSSRTSTSLSSPRGGT